MVRERSADDDAESVEMAPSSGGADRPVAGQREPFAAAYLRLRGLEGRLYPDRVVAALPQVPRTHPLRDEWLQRADSAARLVAYLSDRWRESVIIELGCGNGWLTGVLARVPGSRVVGIDLNEVELAQAARLFASPTVSFVNADLRAWRPTDVAPSVIVAASVIQYVSDLDALVRRLLSWLDPGGELHILDSPLYTDGEIAAARARSVRYYETLGEPGMARHYHHHAWRELDAFRVDVLYRPDVGPRRLLNRALGRRRSQFPWVRVRPSGVP